LESAAALQKRMQAMYASMGSHEGRGMRSEHQH